MPLKKSARFRFLPAACLLAVALAAATLCPAPARAEGEAPASLEERLRKLESLLEAQRRQIDVQQEQIDTLRAELQRRDADREKEAAPARRALEAQAEQIEALKTQVHLTQKSLEEKTAGPRLPDWTENIVLSGLIEFEAGYGRSSSDAPDSRVDGSDLALATVELGVAARVTDWLTGETVLLWEEDDTEPVDLDVGLLRLGDLERFPAYLEAGKLYPPFGNFESFFVTNPVVLELGEARETAVRAGGVFGPFDLSLSAFNGEVDRAGDESDHVDDFVAAASFARESEDGRLCFSAGAGWISNVAESDGLQELVADGAGDLDEDVAGCNLWAALRYGRANLLAEYLGALEDFEANELSLDGGATLLAEESRPEAWNLEAALEMTERLTVAGKYERARDVFSWQHERRWGACASYVLCETERACAILALEYLHGRFDDADDTTEDLATLQLGIEF